MSLTITDICPASLRARSMSTQSQAPQGLQRCILSLEDLKAFRASPAYKKLLDFLKETMSVMPGKPVVTRDEYANASTGVVSGIVKLLLQAFDFIDAFQPREKSARFGDKTFRLWHEEYKKSVAHQFPALLPSRSDSIVLEILSYFMDSFGNPMRVDFGTGHEVNFLVFLFCLRQLGDINDESLVYVGTLLIPLYIDVVRKLIGVYNLEPAGSHGVWSLDDYHFLPFLYGSGQLIGHPHIKPRSILYRDTCTAMKEKYLYLASISFIHEIKRGPFEEHSSILFDIASNMRKWDAVNEGLLRMFEEEVMGKLPVMQHLGFGSIFQLEGSRRPVDGGAKPALFTAVAQAPTKTIFERYFHVARRNRPNLAPPTLVPSKKAKYELLESNSGIRVSGWVISSTTDVMTDEEQYNMFQEKMAMNSQPTLPKAPPEMFFGRNQVSFLHEESNCQILFSAADSLRGCKVSYDEDGVADRFVFKHKLAEIWAQRADHNVAIRQSESSDFDWTYTTTYTGHFAPRSENLPKWQKEETSEHKIDYEHLKIKEPILWYDDVNLFECELDDNGNGQLSVKVRVMPSCFFCLQRMWLRCDGMRIRVFDTRMYHVFGTTTVVFEITRREASYEELKQMGMSTEDRDYTNPDIFASKIPIVSSVNRVTFLDSMK